MSARLWILGAADPEMEAIEKPLVECGEDFRKYTCSGSAEQIQAFLESWAPRNGIVDTYGDPARGFAGGYEKEKESSHD